MSDEPDHEKNDGTEGHDSREAPEESGTDEEPEIRVQRKDGTWEKLEHKPLSDDPEIEAMGKLRWQELQEIVNDPAHPKHDQAVTYSRLLGERMRNSIAPLMGDLSKQYDNILRDISKSFKMPKIKLPKFEVPAMPGFRDYGFVPPALPDSPVPEREDPADHTGDEPAESFDLVSHIVQGQSEMNSLLAEQNRLLRRHASNSAIDSGVQAARASQEGQRSRRALAAAWAAVGVTTLVGIVQICQNANLFWAGG